MKKSVLILIAIITWLSAAAQTERRLNEVTVVASRTTTDAEGYTTNLRGSDITKGKPAVDVLGFLPNISHKNGTFKINGLAASEIYVDGVKLSDLSELDKRGYFLYLKIKALATIVGQFYLTVDYH